MNKIKKILFVCIISVFALEVHAQNFYEIYHKYYDRYVKALGVNQKLAEQLEPNVIKLANYLILYQGYVCEDKIDSANSVRDKMIKLLSISNKEIQICEFTNVGSGGEVKPSGVEGSVQINTGGLFGFDNDFIYYTEKDSLIAGKRLKTEKLYVDTMKIMGISLYGYGRYLYIQNGIKTNSIFLDTLTIKGKTVTNKTSGSTLATKEYVDNNKFTIGNVLDVDKVIVDTLKLGDNVFTSATSGSVISTKEYVDGLINALSNSLTTNNLTVNSKITFKGNELTDITTGSILATKEYVDNIIDDFNIYGDTIKSKYFYATGGYLLSESQSITSTIDTIKFKNQGSGYMYYSNNTFGVGKVELDGNINALEYRNSGTGYFFGGNNLSLKVNNNNYITLNSDSIYFYKGLVLNNGGKINNWRNHLNSNSSIITKGYVDSIADNLEIFTPTTFAIDYPTMTSDNLPQGNINLYRSGRGLESLNNDYSFNVTNVANDITISDIQSEVGKIATSWDGKYVYYVDDDNLYKVVNLYFETPYEINTDIDYVYCSYDGKYVYISKNNSFYISDDFGVTFSQRLYTSTNNWYIVSGKSGHYVMAYDNSNGRIYYSSDYGENFTLVEQGIERQNIYIDRYIDDAYIVYWTGNNVKLYNGIKYTYSFYGAKSIVKADNYLYIIGAQEVNYDFYIYNLSFVNQAKYNFNLYGKDGYIIGGYNDNYLYIIDVFSKVYSFNKISRTLSLINGFNFTVSDYPYRDLGRCIYKNGSYYFIRDNIKDVFRFKDGKIIDRIYGSNLNYVISLCGFVDGTKMLYLDGNGFRLFDVCIDFQDELYVGDKKVGNTLIEATSGILSRQSQIDSIIGMSASKAGAGSVFYSYYNGDGSFDNTFNIGTGFNSIVNYITQQSDGKLVCSGEFTSYNGNNCIRICRLNSNGTFDNTFNIGTGFNSYVNCIIEQSDGKLVCGGHFTSYNGNSCNRICRLNSDGTFDNTFSIGTGFNSIVNYITQQSDGKLICGGYFTSYNGNSCNRICRLNSDGTFDNTFSTGYGFYDGEPLCIIQQSNSKIICVGGFTSYDGNNCIRICRLNSDGTFDNTFSIGTGFNSIVNYIIEQSDGKLICGGHFTSYNGNSCNRICRLNSDGTFDNTFSIGTGFNSIVNYITQQSDGKLVCGGWFTNYDGNNCIRICRLNSNGSFDNTFNIGTGFNNSVYYIIEQSDGKLVCSGEFTSYNGYDCNYICRLNSGLSFSTYKIISTGTNWIYYPYKIAY